MKHFFSHDPSLLPIHADGAVDAERSIVTDLVSQMDPEGMCTHVGPWSLYTPACSSIIYHTGCNVIFKCHLDTE